MKSVVVNLLTLFLPFTLFADPEVVRVQEGLASVYWPDDGQSGEFCADGKRFTKERCHIAHRNWPLGRKVRVCSLRTKKCAVSFIGDRGPFGACDQEGFRYRNKRSCKGKWILKIKNSDPGQWRGIADLSKCVWVQIGGGHRLERVRIELLK